MGGSASGCSPEAWGSHELHVFDLRHTAPARSRATSSGFTLMELLIVISIIVILMLIAIPTANTIRKHTDEVSAQKSLQTIEQAQSMYATNYPVNGFACTLQALAGESTSRAAQPDIRAAHQRPALHRHQGRLHLQHHQLHQGDGQQHRPHHRLCPHRGSRHSRQDRRSRLLRGIGGPIKMDPAGGTNCTQMVQ